MLLTGMCDKVAASVLVHLSPATTGASGAGKSSGKAKGKANGKRKGRDVIKERLMGEVGWIIAFLSIMFYMPLIGLIGTVFHESIPNCFGSPSKAWHTIRCRARHASWIQLGQLLLIKSALLKANTMLSDGRLHALCP